MNRPERIDLEQRWMPLDEEQPPALLVLDESLTKAVLKCDVIGPTDLVGNFKAAARMDQASLPTIDMFFRKTPMLLHGVDQRQARKALQPCYRSIEDGLDLWLSDYALTYFESRVQQSPVSSVALVSDYLHGVNRRIVARNVGCSLDHLPPLPNNLFRLLPRAEQLLSYDQTLHTLVSFLTEQLCAQQRDPDEAWALVSVAVMGQEPLLSGLAFALSSPAPQGGWTPEALMRESAPVSMLGCRQVLADVTLEGVQFIKGQLLYICPFLTHKSMKQCSGENLIADTSYSFGAGAHVCAGRKISLKVVQAFLDAYQQCPQLIVKLKGLRFSRDINLMVQQHA